MLYFDLDVVILQDITWMTQVDSSRFYTLRDFRYLWRPNWTGINSSIMRWDPEIYSWIWHTLQDQDLGRIMGQYPGDQDYLTRVLAPHQVAFFDDSRFQSWRWQVWEGGMDLRTRQSRQPGRGAQVAPGTDVVIFHGRPKPHQIQDPWIQRHWHGQGA